MNWKAVFLVAFAFLLFVGFLAWEDHSEDQQQTKWNEFVAQHHCSILPSKWTQMNRWQCDGFQIEHP